MNTVEREQRDARFRTAIEEIINQQSRENDSNTPDFILAKYLLECLKLFDDTVNRRASWYGRFDKPGQ